MQIQQITAWEQSVFHPSFLDGKVVRRDIQYGEVIPIDRVFPNRFLKSKPLPPESGKVIRQRVWHIFIPVPGKPVDCFYRFLKEQTPPIDSIPGCNVRRGGVAADYIPPVPRIFPNRFVHAQYPPVAYFAGKSWKRFKKEPPAPTAGPRGQSRFVSVPKLWLDFFQGNSIRRTAYSLPTYLKTYGQSYRVADDSLDRYELYIGIDEVPDFTASDQPVATSSTFPVSFTPIPPESGQTLKMYAVTRKRNRYNLLSHNQYPSIIEINELGEEELGPLTAPTILRVLDGELGQIIIFAQYPAGVDRNEADVWDVYVKLGEDPDPDIDDPVESIDFSYSSMDYILREEVSDLTPDATYHIMVVVRRSEPSTDDTKGISEVVEFTLAQSYEIDADDALLFGGQEYEVGQ